MIDEGKINLSSSPPPSGKPTEKGSTISTTIKVGGTGGFLVFLVSKLPDVYPYKSLFLYLCPTGGAILAAMWNWLKREIDAFWLEQVFRYRCRQARSYLSRQYANPNLTPQDKAKLDALAAALTEQEHEYYMNRIKTVPYSRSYSTPFATPAKPSEENTAEH